MTRAQIEQHLKSMREQEATAYEQWTLTRGAVEMLSHLLNTWGDDEDSSPLNESEAEAMRPSRAAARTMKAAEETSQRLDRIERMLMLMMSKKQQEQFEAMIADDEANADTRSDAAVQDDAPTQIDALREQARAKKEAVNEPEGA